MELLIAKWRGKNMSSSFNFEDAILELEKIVEKLEKGDLGLKDSVEIFKRGIEISNSCNEALEEAEQKINIIIKEKNGEIRMKPFEIEEK
jgi:exodeoxyribonuclease VII small subunit